MLSRRIKRAPTARGNKHTKTTDTISAAVVKNFLFICRHYNACAPSNSLFETDFLVVDEKVRAFSFGSAYGIYADGTEPVGFVRQANYSGGAKAAQIMFGRKMKNMQSFEFEITDASGKRVGNLYRIRLCLIRLMMLLGLLGKPAFSDLRSN